jgi:hypothetical protein
MHAALQRVLAQEDVKQRLLSLTVFPLVDETPAAFGAFWRSQIPVWQELVEASAPRRNRVRSAAESPRPWIALGKGRFAHPMVE